ncbi:histidine--tRNA ligase [Candidatus Pacearchaeota archaeon]|nr:histidine--tRNA ligase [Candidatus Pacearchaeota archaeon]
MEVSKMKGFRDVLPPESLKREKVIETIKKYFKLYGFLPVETPTIESDELLKNDGEEDEAVADRYRLKDKAGRDLGLRYEFTVQLSRLFSEYKNIKLPFRRYQIGYVFRDEPVRAERYREFIQCDADIIGDASISADAECLALANDIIKELNIKAEIIVNNRKLIDSILEKLEIKDKKQVLREIDKLDKISEDEVRKNLLKLIDKKGIDNLFELLKKDLNYFVKNNFGGASEIKELIDICSLYGIKPKFSSSLVRGFSYYTGNVFEVFSKEQKFSIASGGRYDKKVGRYAGREIPAVGISFGTIVDYPKVESDSTKAIVISIGKDKEALKFLQELRKNSISSLMLNKLTKALEYANSYSIPYVIFVGEKEVKSRKFKLRDMKSGKEQNLAKEKLIKLLQKQ